MQRSVRLDCPRWVLGRQPPICCVQARATGAKGRRFCNKFGLNLTCRFSLGLYGEAACETLCNFWVSKMSHMWDLWGLEGFPDSYTFRSEDLAGVVEPDDFVALALSAEGHVAGRVRDMRSLAPMRGGSAHSSGLQGGRNPMRIGTKHENPQNFDSRRSVSEFLWPCILVSFFTSSSCGGAG